MKVIEKLITLCGETHFMGIPCALIRFSGCPLRCIWCDSTYAYSGGEEQSAEELRQWVEQSRMSLVLLTGGEPLMQEGLAAFALGLTQDGHDVMVETSGAIDIQPLLEPIIRSIDIKCPSSGESGKIFWNNLNCLRPMDAVKFVIADREDYLYASQVIVEHLRSASAQILLSPVFGRLEPEALARWILEDRLGKVRLNLQLHKLLWPGGEK
jgi:7-carboxy-7-deazaguanine synthase